MFSTLIIVRNDHRMISKGSCDTKDWIYDVENSTLIRNYILKYIQIENCYAYFKL